MINQATKKEWEGVWEKDVTIARHLRRIIKRKHISQGMDVYNSIYERRNIATIARLRTGHCSLNQHLHLIGENSTPHSANAAMHQNLLIIICYIAPNMTSSE